MNQILTLEERNELKDLLDSGRPTVMRLCGDGANREINFNIEGTRQEVRIPFPDEE